MIVHITVFFARGFIMQEIPDIMEELFLAWGPAPDPGQWPEYLREDPVRGYGLFCFCQGLALGLRLSEACRRD
jgi:hypothetical protein